jgi:hypothetical protein
MNEDWTGDLYLKKEFNSIVRKIQYKNGPLSKESDKSQTGILEDFVQKWSASLKQEAFSGALCREILSQRKECSHECESEFHVSMYSFATSLPETESFILSPERR